MHFKSLGRSDNYKVVKGALLCWWDLEDPEIPGISFLVSLDTCIDAPQQLWIEAEVQQKIQISGRGSTAV